MAAKGPSPEKKLLKIIEGQQDEIAKTQTVRATKKIIAPSILKGRFAFFKSKLKKKKSKKEKRASSGFDVKQLNVFLQGALILLVIVFGLSVSFGVSNLQKEQIIQIPEIEGLALADPAPVVSLLQPQDYYFSKIKARDIFKFGDIVKKKEIVFEDDTSQVTRLATLAKGMKIVGISWGVEPDAIIEDIDARKTYFVKKGSMIADVEVKDILKDKVILTDGREEIEIR